MSADPQPQKKRGLLVALVVGVFALVAVGVAALLVNIAERKQEAKHAFVKLVEVTENDVDPAKWGKNWPREFDGYKRTAEPTNTKYGGAAGASEGQPAPEKFDRDPWLKRIFAGYLFAVDYRDRRGHAYMLFDQETTKRNVPAEAKQSGNCLHCHGSIMPLYKKLGKEAAPQASEAEQIQAGLVKVGELSYWDAHKAARAAHGRQGPPGLVRRLPRPAVDGAPRHAAGLHRRDPEGRRVERRRAAPAVRRALAQGRPVEGLRSEPRRHAPGEARATSAASATSSTSAARARRSSSPGPRGSRSSRWSSSTTPRR